MRAFIFPGQGSQVVGMGKALAEASAVARALFEEVDEALGQNLARLMAEGPIEELTLTENAQPAIMANAVATLRVSGISIDKADFVGRLALEREQRNGGPARRGRWRCSRATRVASRRGST